MQLTFETDSLLLVDFTAKVKGGDVFDTTYEEEAKKHSLHEPGDQYQPRLISVGSSSFPVLRGFDEALAKSEAGQKLTVEVEPAKGFGERDSGKVRMIPLRKLGDDADRVSIGDAIEVGGKKGMMVSNTSPPFTLAVKSTSNSESVSKVNCIKPKIS